MASDNDLGDSAIGSNRKKDPSCRKDCLDCSQKIVKKIELMRTHCYSGAICSGEGGRGEEGAVTGQNTYRCYSTTLPDHELSLDSDASHLVLSSGTTARVERRCKIDSVLDSAACQNEAARRERYDCKIKVVSYCASYGEIQRETDRLPLFDKKHFATKREWRP